MSAALMKEIQPVAFKHTWRLRPHILDDHFYLPASSSDYSLSSILSYSLPRSASQVSQSSSIPSEIYDYPSALLPPSDPHSRILLHPASPSSFSRKDRKEPPSLGTIDAMHAEKDRDHDGEGEQEAREKERREEEERRRKKLVEDDEKDHSWLKGKLIPPHPSESMLEHRHVLNRASHGVKEDEEEEIEEEYEPSLRGGSVPPPSAIPSPLTLEQEVQLLKEKKKKEEKSTSRTSTSSSFLDDDLSSRFPPTINITVYFPVAPSYADDEEKQRHLDEQLDLLRLLSSRPPRKISKEDKRKKKRSDKREDGEEGSSLSPSSDERSRGVVNEKEEEEIHVSSEVLTDYTISEEERERVYQETYRGGVSTSEKEQDDDEGERQPTMGGEMKKYSDGPRDKKLEALEKEIRKKEGEKDHGEKEKDGEKTKKKMSWRQRLLSLARRKLGRGDGDDNELLTPDELIEKHTEFISPQLLTWREVRDDEDRRNEMEACARGTGSYADVSHGEGGGGGQEGGLSFERSEDEEACLRAREKRLHAFQVNKETRK